MQLSPDCYRKIIDNLRDGLYIVDRDRKIVYWNHAAELISGFKADEVVGSNCSDNILCHVDDAGSKLCCGRCPIVDAVASGTRNDTEIFLHHKNGQRVPVAVRITPLNDEDGSVIGGVEMFSDLSGRAASEERLRELEKLALLDGLTQLANRHYLERELEARLGELQRYRVRFAVLFLDIDDFKRVNDHYGHETGDRVLQFVAATLAGSSRPFDLYGRWGGEEFLGIMRNVSAADLWQTGERLRKLVASAFLSVEGERLQVTVSIGATLALDGDDIASLVQRADALMYRSKGAGKNRLSID